MADVAAGRTVRGRPALARALVRVPWASLALMAVVGMLVIAPLGFVLARPAALGDLGHTLQSFADFMSRRATVSAIRNTLMIGVPATLIAVGVGLGLAWLFARTDIPGKRVFGSMPLVPILLPRISAAIGWIFLLSPRQGMLNVLYRKVTGSEAEEGPFNPHTMGIIIFVIGINLVPYAYALLYPSLMQMNSELEEAGLASGASEARVVWRVTIPAIRPALLVSFSLCFMLSIAQFSIPFVLGAPQRINVLTTEMYSLLTVYPANYNAVAYIGIVLGLFAVVLLWATRKLTARARFVMVTGKGHNDRLVRLGRWKPVAVIAVTLFGALTLLLPIGALVIGSLLRFWGADYTSGNMTTKWYSELFDDAWAMPALENSFRLALVGSILCVLLASLVAWFELRRRSRITSFASSLAELPIGIPSCIFGVGFLFAFIILWPKALHTSAPLLVMYSVLFLPFALRSVSSSLHQISPELEEAAHVSGASTFGAFRRVTLPLLKNGMFYGWLLVLAILFRELEATAFLVTPGSQVFATALLDMLGFAQWPFAAAYSVLVLGLTLVLMAVAGSVLRIGQRKSSSRRRAMSRLWSRARPEGV